MQEELPTWVGVVATGQEDHMGNILDINGVDVPKEVPVTLEFDHRRRLGTCQVVRAPDGKSLIGNIKLSKQALDLQGCLEDFYPAISGLCINQDDSILRNFSLASVGIVEKPLDPGVKPLKEMKPNYPGGTITTVQTRPTRIGRVKGYIVDEVPAETIADHFSTLRARRYNTSKQRGFPQFTKKQVTKEQARQKRKAQRAARKKQRGK